MLHILLHFIVPLLISVLFFRNRWLLAYGIMLLGLLIDADHLLAEPIYDANRCSIGFHPLHTYGPIAFYVLLLIPKKTRILALGLCIHIALDALDCYRMLY